jgi:alpha-tubulin suppressor-like RCC1 family protein
MPALVAGGVRFTQISSGSYHSCGLTKIGKAYCWGLNGEGAVGNGTPDNLITVPSAVAGGLTFTQIAVGGSHTCGLTISGEAYCWGWDVNGQLGNGVPLVSANTPSPVAGGFTFTQISAGLVHTCGVTRGGEAYCWGTDSFGQLGNGLPLANTNVPSPVAGGLTLTQVNAGSSHTCGLTTGGQAYCWGSDAQGQLGHGALFGSNVPSLVLGGFTFTQVSVGFGHSCGVTKSGEAYCWGFDSFGQLGNGSSLANRDVPSLVAGGLKFAQVSAGLYHTCGLTRGGGQAYCWGRDGNGELGNGATGATDTPSPVSAPGL